MNQQNPKTNEKKHNYFYKIANLINGKYYYGIHSTNNLNDGYMGSGKTLNKAIKKHGVENFKKEIIADYPTRKEASDHEKRIVTKELIELDECYNLRTGGDNEFIFSEDFKKHISELAKGRIVSEETKQKISQKTKGINNPFFGKTHSEETKQKIREKNSGVNAYNFGRKFTDEHKEKIGKKHKGKTISIENRIALSKRFKGCKLSSEHKEKIRKSMLGKKNSLGKPLSELQKFKSKRNRKNAKKCEISGICFYLVRDAALYFECNEKVIIRRIKSTLPKWADWKFI